LAEGTILQGWSQAEQQPSEDGIAQMRQALAAYRATGAEMGRPSHLALLAEACEGTEIRRKGWLKLKRGWRRWQKQESAPTRPSCTA